MARISMGKVRKLIEEFLEADAAYEKAHAESGEKYRQRNELERELADALQYCGHRRILMGDNLLIEYVYESCNHGVKFEELYKLET